MSLNQPVGIPFQNPTSYVGPEQNIVPIKRFPRRPLTTDKRFRVGQFALLGKNPSTGTEGDLWYLARFESNGDATWLEFSNETAVGAWNLLSTQTASASASIAFTSQVTSLYSTYAIILSGVVPVTEAVNFILEYSIDAGANWLVTGYENYVQSRDLYGASDTLTTTHVALNSPTTGGATDLRELSNTALKGYTGEVYLTQLNIGASPRVDFKGSYYFPANPGGGNIADFGRASGGGSGPDGITVNALRVRMSSGNIATGIISLYGITS